MKKNHRVKCKFKAHKGKTKVILKMKIKKLNLICPVQPYVKPEVRRYFYIAPHDIHLSDEPVVLWPPQFVDDQGEPVARFIDYGQSGYFNLYVNGVLQEGKLYRAESDSLSIVPTGQTIHEGTSVILESIGFIIASVN